VSGKYKYGWNGQWVCRETQGELPSCKMRDGVAETASWTKRQPDPIAHRVKRTDGVEAGRGRIRNGHRREPEDPEAGFQHIAVSSISHASGSLRQIDQTMQVGDR